MAFNLFMITGNGHFSEAKSANIELSALTRGLSTFCIFHCFSIAPGTTEKGHKTLYISSFKFSFRNFDVYNRFIYLHFIPAVGTTVVVFFRKRAEGEV